MTTPLLLLRLSSLMLVLPTTASSNKLTTGTACRVCSELGGTAITSTAAELNILTMVLTIYCTELNLLDGCVALLTQLLLQV